MNTRLDVIDILIGLAVVLMLCSLGCATRTQVREIAYSSDGQVAPEMIAAACAMWAVVDVQCAPATGEANVAITGVPPHEDIDGSAGIYDGLPIRLTINLVAADPVVIAHEFGHALGLDHLGPDWAVMNFAEPYGLTGLTPLDISAYRAHMASE